MRRLFAVCVLALAPTGCSSWHSRGVIGDVTIEISGHAFHEVEIAMDAPLDAEPPPQGGTVWIDGVCYGRVRRGDLVQVSKTGVRVNGDARAPSTESIPRTTDSRRILRFTRTATSER